jgi:hypothetical protein
VIEIVPFHIRRGPLHNLLQMLDINGCNCAGQADA